MAKDKAVEEAYMKRFNAPDSDFTDTGVEKMMAEAEAEVAAAKAASKAKKAESSRVLKGYTATPLKGMK